MIENQDLLELILRYLHPASVKFASQVLYSMWVHQELRDVYKKAGWKEADFVTKNTLVLTYGARSSNHRIAECLIEGTLVTQEGS